MVEFISQKLVSSVQLGSDSDPRCLNNDCTETLTIRLNLSGTSNFVHMTRRVIK